MWTNTCPQRRSLNIQSGDNRSVLNTTGISTCADPYMFVGAHTRTHMRCPNRQKEPAKPPRILFGQPHYEATRIHLDTISNTTPKPAYTDTMNLETFPIQTKTMH